MSETRGEGVNGKGAGISVVVPTYNCADLLEMTLETLSAQTLDSASYEVIVVDDGSTDHTRAVLARFEERLALTCHFQEDRGFRAAAARNVGIGSASFGVTLFIDSGILLSSRVLALHAAAHARTRPLALIGLSYGVSEYQTIHADVLRSLAAYPVDVAIEKMRSCPQLDDCRTSYMGRIGFDLQRMADPWLIFWSGHASVSTDLLRSTGGFDEWFVTWGGEDVEMGLRLHEAGCPFRVLPTIESIHYPHQKNAQDKRASSMSNVSYIYEKHGHESVRRLLHEGWEQIATSR